MRGRTSFTWRCVVLTCVIAGQFNAKDLRPDWAACVRGVARRRSSLCRQRRGLPLGIVQLIDNWVWGVDIFFMLRGFILAYTYLPSRATAFGWVDYRSFIVKRFARVYPLYLVTFLVFVGRCFVAKRAGTSCRGRSAPNGLPFCFCFRGAREC
ncbi:hypothetical protein [Paraburkholderia sp. CI3]|uniref:hypothetical protein n=1 Tax=Paraburkholderia sp. CI3 TaxID=2991060 RepID=UPI003D23331D